jgi:hypothetical protein
MLRAAIAESLAAGGAQAGVGVAAAADARGSGGAAVTAASAAGAGPALGPAVMSMSTAAASTAAARAMFQDAVQGAPVSATGRDRRGSCASDGSHSTMPSRADSDVDALEAALQLSMTLFAPQAIAAGGPASASRPALALGEARDRGVTGAPGLPAAAAMPASLPFFTPLVTTLGGGEGAAPGSAASDAGAGCGEAGQMQALDLGATAPGAAALRAAARPAGRHSTDAGAQAAGIARRVLPGTG